VRNSLLSSTPALKLNAISVDIGGTFISVKQENKKSDLRKNNQIISVLALILSSQDARIMHLPRFIKNDLLIAEENRNVNRK